MENIFIISVVLFIWTFVNIVWMYENNRKIRPYRTERNKLINWLEEVPEFWGVDEKLWNAQMNRIKMFLEIFKLFYHLCRMHNKILTK